MKITIIIVLLLFIGCTVQNKHSCTLTKTESTDVLKATEKKIECNCLCPSNRSIIDLGGLFGGLLNLWEE